MDNGFKEKKSPSPKRKVLIALASAAGILVVLVSCVSCMNNVGWLTDESESSEYTPESPAESLPLVISTVDSSETREPPKAYEFDTLQTAFIKIDEKTTILDIETLISQQSLPFTAQDYNSSNKIGQITTYKIAYTEGSALQRYADSGDYLEISFKKSDGTILNAEYCTPKSDKSALFYNYGVWFSLSFDSPGDYTGYYAIAPLEKENGIIIKYENGNETKTNYFKCESAETSMKTVIDSFSD